MAVYEASGVRSGGRCHWEVPRKGVTGPPCAAHMRRSCAYKRKRAGQFGVCACVVGVGHVGVCAVYGKSAAFVGFVA